MGSILLLETPVDADRHRRATARKTRQQRKYLADTDSQRILPADLADSSGRRRKMLQKQQGGSDQEHGRYNVQTGKSLLYGRTEHDTDDSRRNNGRDNEPEHLALTRFLTGQIAVEGTKESPEQAHNVTPEEDHQRNEAAKVQGYIKGKRRIGFEESRDCLLYTSDAADDLLCVDL